MTETLRFVRVNCIRRQGSSTLKILHEASFTIHDGEIVALVAPSGAGKSTLLELAGLLTPPQSGEIFISKTPTSRLSDAQRTALRRARIGFVYQFHHLLPELSALENVMMPNLIAQTPARIAKIKATELLHLLRLETRLHHYPSQLSGGEQQRVAIARAVANLPRLLLADEPTGNLDPHTSEIVFAMIMAIVRKTRLSALIATHNVDVAARMDRAVTIRDGAIIEITP